MIDPLVSPLLTDLYQLTMLQGYIDQGMDETAVFELFVRKLPDTRGFLLCTGLESVLSFLDGLRVTDDEIAYLSASGRFSPGLVDYLKGVRFTGDVHALPEGSVFFEDEPVIRITAPLCQAQLVETRVMNLLQQQILFASKAARCILAAAGKASLVDFGLRRAHGAEAGLYAARSSYIAGFVATSTVLAETLFGIPISGTMAHSFVEAHNDEEDAFLNFGLANPGNVTLLIDTYDTLRGARKAVTVAGELRRRGIRVRAVRLDSGDLFALSRAVREILDAGGFPEIEIFVSGNMDEYGIADLISRGAPIDGFGVGTKMDTSEDAPYLECAYKLVEYAGTARMKKSSGKVTWPGRKQIFRHYDGDCMAADVLAVDGEALPGVPLMVPVMKDGVRVATPRSLGNIVAAAREELRALPASLRVLGRVSPPYPVRISPALQKLREHVARRVGL